MNDPRTSFSSLMKGDSKASVNMSATNMEMSRLPKKNRVSRNQLISIVKVLQEKRFFFLTVRKLFLLENKQLQDT